MKKIQKVMLTLVKQVFIALLSFSGSLTTTCKFLNNEPCITRSTLVDLDPDDISHYKFMVNFDKYDWSYNIILLMIHQVVYLFQTKKII